MKITQPNWEAMEVALGRLRIECMTGQCRRAESELTYLLDNLNRLYVQVHRCAEDEK